jgi:hypothetical protein
VLVGNDGKDDCGLFCGTKCAFVHRW